MTYRTVTLALYLLIALIPGVIVHEYAHALVADRLGDPTPRRWGRLTLDPRPHIDRFGTVVLPALLLLLVAVGAAFIPFAYGKPMPYEPSYLRNPERDETLVALAGPFANLGLAVAAGLVLRVVPCGELSRFVLWFLFMNVVLFVFNLIPIPGLDGARIIARFLQGRAQQLYVDANQYLPLFMLVVFFLLSAPILTIVGSVSTWLSSLLGGSHCLLI
ncbi:MAG TPA: site-2 protease family protein [Actinomycetota bacterium]